MEEKGRKRKRNQRMRDIPFPSSTFLKKERKTMINATPAISPMRIANVFSMSSSLSLS